MPTEKTSDELRVSKDSLDEGTFTLMINNTFTMSINSSVIMSINSSVIMSINSTLLRVSKDSLDEGMFTHWLMKFHQLLHIYIVFS